MRYPRLVPNLGKSVPIVQRFKEETLVDAFLILAVAPAHKIGEVVQEEEAELVVRLSIVAVEEGFTAVEEEVEEEVPITLMVA